MQYINVVDLVQKQYSQAKADFIDAELRKLLGKGKMPKTKKAEAKEPSKKVKSSKEPEMTVKVVKIGFLDRLHKAAMILFTPGYEIEVCVLKKGKAKNAKQKS